MRLQKIFGQESWTLKTERVELALTRQAGHLAPVRFRVGHRWIEPFEVAPWADEPLPAGSPLVLQVMRGDFFCLPFGANATAWKGEQHPMHGETANAQWKLKSADDAHLHVSLRTRIRPGRVDKYLRLIPGQAASARHNSWTKAGAPTCT